MSRALAGLVTGLGRGIAAQGRIMHEATIEQAKRERADRKAEQLRKDKEAEIKRKQKIAEDKRKREEEAAKNRPSRISVFKQELAEAGIKENTPEYKQAIYAKLGINFKTDKPDIPFDIPSGFQLIDRDNPDKGVKPIPGADKDQNSSTSFQGKEREKARQTIGRVNDAVKLYRGELDRASKGDHLDFLPSENMDRLISTFNNAKLELKELYNLGVLNGPDERIIEDIIGNPNSFSNLTRDIFGDRPKELIKILDRVVGDKIKEVEKRYGLVKDEPKTNPTKRVDPTADPAKSDPLDLRSTLDSL